MAVVLGGEPRFSKLNKTIWLVHFIPHWLGLDCNTPLNSYASMAHKFSQVGEI